MAARQPSNELADILSRAADPEIRQAGLRDAAKLLRAVIGIDVPLGPETDTCGRSWVPSVDSGMN